VIARRSRSPTNVISLQPDCNFAFGRDSPDYRSVNYSVLFFFLFAFFFFFFPSFCDILRLNPAGARVVASGAIAGTFDSSAAMRHWLRQIARITNSQNFLLPASGCYYANMGPRDFCLRRFLAGWPRIKGTEIYRAICPGSSRARRDARCSALCIPSRYRTEREEGQGEKRGWRIRGMH